MSAEDAAQLVRPVDTLGMGLGPCHPAGVPRRARSTHRLGGPAHQRRVPRRVHRPVLPPERPLPQPLLRPARTAAQGHWGEHRLRAGGLPAVLADHRAVGAAGDDDDRHPAGRGRSVQPVAARRSHDPRAAPGRGRPRPPADRRARRRVPAHVRAAAGAPALARPRRDRRRGRVVGPAAAAARGTAPGGGERDRRAHQRADRRRVHAPDRVRSDPLGGGVAARAGRRRRLRHPHRDVHHRPDGPPQVGQGHQPQGSVRRRLGDDLRRRAAPSSTSGSTATATSPSSRSTS